MTENQKKLFDAAAIVQKHAHAPYSGAHIGAAVRMTDGNVFTGCNIENASYGGTVCAERVAIWKSISEGAAKQISEILVLSDAQAPWPPCGMCRQVIAEFATPQTVVYTANLSGQMKTFKFSEIFPESFTPDFLNKIEAEDP